MALKQDGTLTALACSQTKLVSTSWSLKYPAKKRALTFRDVVAATGHRDVLYILESKMHMSALLQMKGFVEWKERSG